MIVTLIAATACLGNATAQVPSPPTPTATVPIGALPTMTPEEWEEHVKELDKQIEQDPAVRIVIVAGTETAGTSIKIAGIDIQLPPDAWVEEYTSAAECVRAPCPPFPWYAIRRGTERILVDGGGGLWPKDRPIPEEFAFLVDALGESGRR